jgi:RES domain-containing protein
MIVYRLSKTRYAHDLTGEGARLHGGRWNHQGIACLYTASTRALAVLEFSVNVNIEDVPRALSMATIEIPDTIYRPELRDLPGNWDDFPAPASAKDFGSRLLTDVDFPVIQVPSTIVPQEFNFLVNTGHPDARQCKVLLVEDFIYDVRIKLR